MKSTVYLVASVVLIGLAVLIPAVAWTSGVRFDQPGPIFLCALFGAVFVLKYRTSKLIEQRKKLEDSQSRAEGWPDSAAWAALKSNLTMKTKSGPMFVWTVPCGDLAIPSGRLAACDPFVELYDELPFVPTPIGRFPVVVTMADVSKAQDRSHLREAYASVVFKPDEEERRDCLVPAKEAETRTVAPDRFIGFGVDSGTACFVDPTVVGAGMPEHQKSWHEGVFSGTDPGSWFSRMDSDEIQKGVANIVLPRATQGENIVIFHSGWGDGVYPVIGGYSALGELVAVHIDFGVVP